MENTKILIHEKYMKTAINNAKNAGHHFGALIVKDDKIVGRMGQRPVGDPRYHAETTAIFNACDKLKTRDLTGCILYSTCEPCPMCFYMSWTTNISKIVYGANIKDAENAGIKQIEVSNKYMNKKSGKKIKIIKNVLKKECIELLKSH